MKRSVVAGFGNTPPFIAALFGVAFLLAFAHFLVVEWLPPIHPSFTNLFDLDEERNIPTWFSSMQLAGVATLLGVFALDRFQNGMRPWGIVMASLVFFLLSLDETALIHERLGRLIDRLVLDGGRKETILPNTGMWVFPLAPLLLGVFWLLWRNARKYLHGFRGKRYLIGGACLFLAAATGIELLSNFVDESNRSIVVALEEVGEIVGITLVLRGVYDLCRHNNVVLKFGAPG